MPLLNLNFTRLELSRKVKVLEAFGASSEVVSLIKEIELKNKELEALAPDAAKAFGFGCGGVTC